MLLRAIRLSLCCRRLLLCGYGLLATAVGLRLGPTRGALRSLRIAGARGDLESLALRLRGHIGSKPVAVRRRT